MVRALSDCFPGLTYLAHLLRQDYLIAHPAKGCCPSPQPPEKSLAPGQAAETQASLTRACQNSSTCLLLLIFILETERESMSRREGHRERERESQAASTLSAEPES